MAAWGSQKAIYGKWPPMAKEIQQRSFDCQRTHLILQEGLWWLPGGPKRRNRIRQVLLLGALATAIIALQGRVIFPAFGQYIQLHPPWNYAAVTVTLFGFAALAVLYLAGAFKIMPPSLCHLWQICELQQE